jgi:hypothetical protein
MYRVRIACLRGAEEMLLRTHAVSVEVSLYDFYQESSSLLGVEEIMHKASMALWDVSKILKNPKNLRTDWVELVYRRKKGILA